MKFNWKIITTIVISVILIGLAAAYFSYLRTINAPNERITENTLIKVGADESTSSIADALFELNLIQSKELFLFYERSRLSAIKPGYYEITTRMSLVDVANLINSGQTKIIKARIPEGYRTEQIAAKLSSLGIVSYAGFMTAAVGKEGTLFPDTYFLDPIMTGEAIVAKMEDDYNTRIDGMSVSAKDLVLASIVEKEAADDDTDRGIIAGIYQNRIDAGMKLQSDPTVSYGRDSNNIATMSVENILDYSFWKAAKTVEFTSVNSLYNTYQHLGLPPAPICNPGLASIRAAQNPTPSDYYYFLYGKDKILHPASTLDGHKTNVAKYL